MIVFFAIVFCFAVVIVYFFAVVIVFFFIAVVIVFVFVIISRLEMNSTKNILIRCGPDFSTFRFARKEEENISQE